MPSRLRSDYFNKGLYPPEAHGCRRLPLPGIHRVNTGSDHLRYIDSEIYGKSDYGYNDPVQ